MLFPSHWVEVNKVFFNQCWYPYWQAFHHGPISPFIFQLRFKSYENNSFLWFIKFPQWFTWHDCNALCATKLFCCDNIVTNSTWGHNNISTVFGSHIIISLLLPLLYLVFFHQRLRTKYGVEKYHISFLKSMGVHSILIVRWCLCAN